MMRFVRSLLAALLVLVDVVVLVPMYVLATPLTRGCDVRAHCESVSLPVEMLLLAGLAVVAVSPLVAAVRLARR